MIQARAASGRGWPFGAFQALMWVLGGLLIAGALAAWIAGRHRRREGRLRGRRIAALERELAATQAGVPGAGETAPARLAAHG